jgi:hypothetical protein
MIEYEQHIVAGRTHIAVGGCGHSQLIRARLEREKIDPLVLIERVSYGSKTEQGDFRDCVRVTSFNAELLTVDNAGRGFRVFGARAFK